MTQKDLIHYMDLAVTCAKFGIQQKDGGPFGAVIVMDNKVVGAGHNQVLNLNDPTAHGEIMAIRDAGRMLHTYDLSKCILFTTGEPCPMCLAAIKWANIDKIYYGASTEDIAEIGFRDKEMHDEFEGFKSNCGVEMIQVCRDECLKLFEEYNNSSHKLY